MKWMVKGIKTRYINLRELIIAHIIDKHTSPNTISEIKDKYTNPHKITEYLYLL